MLSNQNAGIAKTNKTFAVSHIPKYRMLYLENFDKQSNKLLKQTTQIHNFARMSLVTMYKIINKNNPAALSTYREHATKISCYV